MKPAVSETQACDGLPPVALNEPYKTAVLEMRAVGQSSYKATQWDRQRWRLWRQQQ